MFIHLVEFLRYGDFSKSKFGGACGSGMGFLGPPYIFVKSYLIRSPFFNGTNIYSKKGGNDAP